MTYKGNVFPPAPMFYTSCRPSPWPPVFSGPARGTEKIRGEGWRWQEVGLKEWAADRVGACRGNPKMEQYRVGLGGKQKAGLLEGK